MKELELLLLQFLQKGTMNEELYGTEVKKYLFLDNELFHLTKIKGKLEIFIVTDYNINNYNATLMSIYKVVDNTYKVQFKDMFFYLIKEKEARDLHPEIIPEDLRLIRESEEPIRNYIKFKS